MLCLVEVKSEINNVKSKRLFFEENSIVICYLVGKREEKNKLEKENDKWSYREAFGEKTFDIHALIF